MGDRDKVAEYKVLSLLLLTKTQSSQLTAEQPLTKKTNNNKKKLEHKKKSSITKDKRNHHEMAGIVQTQKNQIPYQPG